MVAELKDRGESIRTIARGAGVSKSTIQMMLTNPSYEPSYTVGTRVQEYCERQKRNFAGVQPPGHFSR